MPADNPLLATWSTPFGAPPFQAIAPEHFQPAFEASLAAHRQEIDAIAADPQAPSFANTIVALEASGRPLRQVSGVFYNLTGAHTNDALQAVERAIAPVLSRHRDAIYLDEALFRRVDDLYGRRGTLGLDPEQDRVLERYHTAFLRAGAGRPAEVKTRLAAIGERLASLGTRFGQNVLADEKDWTLVLEGEQDLAGLPDALREAAAQAAADRGLEGRHVITLSRSSIEPFLQFSTRRDLRERAFKAWLARGEGGGATDNRGIIAEMVALRAERAALLGYDSFAQFRLADSMARTPEAAMGLLRSVWTPARARALEERAALQALAAAEGGNFDIEPWDWRFYAERRRKAEFDLDEAEIKPYLQLDRIIAAAFATASRLFDLHFTERFDVPTYHPDVRVFEVTDAQGRLVGLFLGDYYARSSKRSGAWMSAFRTQEKLGGDIRPIIVNVMNFARAGEGRPTLLSFDDARTLFHEFGHALHGLLSDVTYPLIAGTNVARDFVEFPSQLYEHWLEQPEVLREFAVHHRTGAPMPAALQERLLATRTFNQGFATVEYVASALVDLEMHLLDGSEALDAGAFEARVLGEIAMPAGMVMRHRLPHFQHVFAGDGYSSAYYSYLWSEVLDADGFGAFEEAGGIFDAATSARLREEVYAAGNRREPEAAYRAFRGRDPDPGALLRKRGLPEPVR
ncbi:M3 family metallopeptidase [Labrys wisconsinensis]|uniref:Peptidyl-dipeptidase Dcp n=1 Tax=Labrys wisconsinensis TaxID=425677 RepID=A0ABU0JDD0_9HYPH|nr:M3 family metallopeptidase [Labrys wisconsinensis]MDQ0471526.1 peptidyl-dipeptidase Dcp [Labrys wisconsinensis]